MEFTQVVAQGKAPRVERRTAHALRLAIHTVTLLCVARTALACGHAGATDFCGPEKIGMLYVTTSGNVYVLPSSMLVGNGVACTPLSGQYAVLSSAAPNFKEVYATLLAAKLSDYQVKLVMDPTQSQCTITYVTLQ
jgi:hypothetical protein